MKRSPNKKAGIQLRDIIRMLKKRTLLRKLVSLMMIIGLVPMLLFGALSIFTFGQVLRAQTAQYQAALVEKRKLYIDRIMIDIESLAANLSGIEDISSAIEQSPSSSAYDRLSTQAKIGYILNGYTNLEGLVSIDIFSKGGAHYHVGETLNATNIRSDLLDRLYLEASGTDGYLYWSGVETNINLESQHPQVIMAARLMQAKTDTAKVSDGIMIISYDPAVFSSIVAEKDSNAGYSIVIDEKNRIIIHPSVNYVGKTVTDGIANRLQGNTGEFITSIDGRQMMAIYSRTDKGGWAIVSFVPLDSISAKSNLVTAVFSLLLIVAILAILYFGVIVSKQIVFPIKQVIDTFTALKNGQLEKAERLTILTQDEIGELGNLFNSFVDAREDITMQKKLERQLNDQNLELQAAMAKLKETQAQMLSQEKLAGIGQLAAGVAHEINNPLGYVTGNMDVLGKYIMRYETILDAVHTNMTADAAGLSGAAASSGSTDMASLWKSNRIDMIRCDMKDIQADTADGLSRIAVIVNGLKTFSRISRPEEKSPLSINDCIKTTLLVVNNELKYNCTVHFLPDEQLPMILANSGQINQVLLNILINSVHAIKKKFGDSRGDITIKTWADDNGVYCSIADNGCGMSQDVMNHVFEPFFTTKPVGQGTGLGLGIAYDIVATKHGGAINVESSEGEGTCFTVFLPFAADDTAREVKPA